MEKYKGAAYARYLDRQDALIAETRQPGYYTPPADLSPDGLDYDARAAKIKETSRLITQSRKMTGTPIDLDGLQAELDELETAQRQHEEREMEWFDTRITTHNIRQVAAANFLEHENFVEAVRQNHVFLDWMARHHADELPDETPAGLNRRRERAVEFLETSPEAREVLWDTTKRFGKGWFTNTASDLTGGAGAVASRAGADPIGQPLIAMADEAQFAAQLRLDPRQRDATAAKVSETAGTLTGILAAGGAAGEGAKIVGTTAKGITAARVGTMAVQGGLANTRQQYDAARQSGLSHREALKTVVPSLAVGVAGSLPFGGKAAGSALYRVIAEAGQNSAQGVATQVANNTIARKTYDPGRELLEGATEGLVLDVTLGSTGMLPYDPRAILRSGVERPGGDPIVLGMHEGGETNAPKLAQEPVQTNSGSEVSKEMTSDDVARIENQPIAPRVQEILQNQQKQIEAGDLFPDAVASRVDKLYEKSHERVENQPTRDSVTGGLSMVLTMAQRRADHERNLGVPDSGVSLQKNENQSREKENLDREGVSFHWSGLAAAFRRRSRETHQRVRRASEQIELLKSYKDKLKISVDLFDWLTHPERQPEGPELRQALEELRSRVAVIGSSLTFARFGRFDEGVEVTVYLDEKRDVVYKLVRIEGGYAGGGVRPGKLHISRDGELAVDYSKRENFTFLEYLDRIELNNAHGGLTPTEWIGVTKDDYAVFVQPFVYGKEVDFEEGKVKAMGLSPIGGPSGYLALSTVEGKKILFADLHEGNVRESADGEVEIIDAYNRELAPEEIALIEKVEGRSVADISKKAKPALRLHYEKKVREIKARVDEILIRGGSEEEAARAALRMRNELKMEVRKETPPQLLRQIEERNVKRYGNILGPSIEELRAKGKTWKDIIDSASRPGGEDIQF